VAADGVGRRTVLRAGALAAAGPLVAACGAVDNLLTASSVRVAVTWGDAELAAFQSVLNGFRRRYPQYEVDVIPLGDAIADAVSAQVNGRPDLVILPRPGLITENLPRIAPLPNGVWRDDWLPQAWRDVVWHRDPRGALVPYGLPFKVTNESALWYRADLFDKLHLSPPTTWSELLDDVRKLKGTGEIHELAAKTLCMAAGTAQGLIPWANQGHRRIAHKSRKKGFALFCLDLRPFSSEPLPKRLYSLGVSQAR